MLTRRLILACAFTSANLLLASVASAQDSATAGALFEKGVADMEAGQFASACPALEESQRIDPRPGTLFTLAECDARWGKVASATARYQEYVDLVSRLTRDQQLRHNARVDVAQAQLAKLKPSVPMLTLVLPPEAPSGTFVTRNGEMLKGAALGLPLPVDPGEYVIVTHAPGTPEREIKLTLRLGETKSVQLEAAAARPTPNASAPNATSAASPVETAPKPSPGGGHKTAAYIAGGVGLAGIAIGSVTGILVFGKKSTIRDNCVGTACNDQGLEAAKSGKNLALISDIGFGVGVAGLALGTILLVTGNSASTEHEPEHEHATRWRPVFEAGRNGASTGLLRRW